MLSSLPKNTILVVSTPKQGKKSLVLQTFENPKDCTWTRVPLINNLEGNLSSPFIIETKHFSAPTNFLSVPASLLPFLLDRKNKILNPIRGIQALILVFNPNDKESFSAISQWKEFVKLFQPDIRMAIANIKGTLTNLSVLDTFYDILNEEFVELVKADLSKPQPKKRSKSLLDSADSDPIEGFERYFECLHSHLWRDFSPKKNTPPGVLKMLGAHVSDEPKVINQTVSVSTTTTEATTETEIKTETETSSETLSPSTTTTTKTISSSKTIQNTQPLTHGTGNYTSINPDLINLKENPFLRDIPEEPSNIEDFDDLTRSISKIQQFKLDSQSMDRITRINQATRLIQDLFPDLGFTFEDEEALEGSLVPESSKTIEESSTTSPTVKVNQQPTEP